jgi:hypothetical protein
MSTVTLGRRPRLTGLLFFVGMPALLLTLSAFNMLDEAENCFAAQEKEFQLSALMRRLTAPAKDGKPLDLSQIYLAADTRDLANANLQQHLAQSITRASGKIIETSALDFVEYEAQPVEGGIGVKASFDIENDGLLALLHGLETGLPLVFVDKLSVRRVPGEPTGTAPEKLRVDLEATGRWRAPAS